MKIYFLSLFSFHNLCPSFSVVCPNLQHNHYELFHLWSLFWNIYPRIFESNRNLFVKLYSALIEFHYDFHKTV
ncbi:hypothetical protein GLOIN_2v1534434, partial [Rhizophagus irregularis DAOM 181602=DAOM 197198]